MAFSPKIAPATNTKMNNTHPARSWFDLSFYPLGSRDAREAVDGTFGPQSLRKLPGGQLVFLDASIRAHRFDHDGHTPVFASNGANLRPNDSEMYRLQNT